MWYFTYVGCYNDICESVFIDIDGIGWLTNGFLGKTYTPRLTVATFYVLTTYTCNILLTRVISVYRITHQSFNAIKLTNVIFILRFLYWLRPRLRPCTLGFITLPITTLTGS